MWLAPSPSPLFYLASINCLKDPREIYSKEWGRLKHCGDDGDGDEDDDDGEDIKSAIGPYWR
jgi:hypothetical protein